MKRYETVLIALPDLADDERRSVFGKLKDIISKGNGTLIRFDEWGLKTLSYEIKKQTRGYYVCIDYAGSGSIVKELERVMGIDDRVIKYMTVLKDTDFDPNSIVIPVAPLEPIKVGNVEVSQVPLVEPLPEQGTVIAQDEERIEK
ncbi:MAG: 30S ribosomal protein S6 [Pseudomonadota bacterium]